MPLDDMPRRHYAPRHYAPRHYAPVTLCPGGHYAPVDTMPRWTICPGGQYASVDNMSQGRQYALGTLCPEVTIPHITHKC